MWYLTVGLFGNLSNSNRLYSIFVFVEPRGQKRTFQISATLNWKQYSRKTVILLFRPVNNVANTKCVFYIYLVWFVNNYDIWCFDCEYRCYKKSMVVHVLKRPGGGICMLDNVNCNWIIARCVEVDPGLCISKLKLQQNGKQPRIMQMITSQ